MQIISSIDSYTTVTNSIVTVGSFDGVHLGHRAIFKQLNAEAKARCLHSVVVTFDPHPQQVLHPERHFEPITTVSKKIELIAQEAVDFLVLLPFTREFSLWTAEQFFQSILIDRLGAKAIVMGPDNAFGKNHEGNHQTIRQFCNERGVSIIEIPELLLRDSAVRSTRIRELINQNNFAQASELLGYSYEPEV